jgi:hypothetical protein
MMSRSSLRIRGRRSRAGCTDTNLNFVLDTSSAGRYKQRYRAMPNLVLVQPLLADVLVNGMAAFSITVVGYLILLRIREKRQQRKDLVRRDRERRSHWGYV